MTPSVTIEMEGIVADLVGRGVDVVSMNAGEPDFNTPRHIMDACNDAMRSGHTHYCKVSGIPELREAICEKFLQDNDIRYSPDQIVVSTGAKQAVYNSVLAVCNPGDEVIIPRPCWVSYVEMVKLAGGVPVVVDTSEEDFILDLDRIAGAITPRTKAIMLNTPNNPCGVVYSRDSLLAVGEMAVKHGFYVIADEIYEKIIYGGAKHVSIAALSPEIYDRTITINGFSKAYAMTGWRLGYAAAPRDIARGMASLQGHITSNSTTFVQWAGVAALKGPQQELEDMRREFEERRDYLLKALRELPDITCPGADGAFYLMPNVSAYYGKQAPDGRRIEDSVQFCNYLLKNARVAIVPGAAFMSPDTVRIAYSNKIEELKKGVERIAKALSELK